MQDPKELIRASDGTYDASLHAMKVDPWATPAQAPDWSHLENVGDDALFCHNTPCDLGAY